jgi:hypothetical protein
VDKRLRPKKPPTHTIKLGIFRHFFNRKKRVDKKLPASNFMGIARITEVCIDRLILDASRLIVKNQLIASNIPPIHAKPTMAPVWGCIVHDAE